MRNFSKAKRREREAKLSYITILVFAFMAFIGKHLTLKFTLLFTDPIAYIKICIFVIKTQGVFCARHACQLRIDV